MIDFLTEFDELDLDFVDVNYDFRDIIDNLDNVFMNEGVERIGDVGEFEDILENLRKLDDLEIRMKKLINS